MLDHLTIHELFGHLRALLAQPNDPQHHARLNALCARAWRLDPDVFTEQWAPYLRAAARTTWRLVDLEDHLQRHAREDARALPLRWLSRLAAGHPVPETIILFKTLEITPALAPEALSVLVARADALRSLTHLTLPSSHVEALLLALIEHDLGPRWMHALHTITLTGPFPATGPGWHDLSTLLNTLARPLDELRLLGEHDAPSALDLAALEVGLHRYRVYPIRTIALGHLDMRYDDDPRGPDNPYTTISFSHYGLTPDPPEPPPHLAQTPSFEDRWRHDPPQPEPHLDVQPTEPPPRPGDPIQSQPAQALRRATHAATGATHIRIIAPCTLRPHPALEGPWLTVYLS